MTQKLTKIRFNILDDLTLLRGVLSSNPFEDYSRWAEVQNNLIIKSGKNFSLRCVREHVEHLLKLFNKGDKGNLRKSGTESQYDEKEELLQQIVDLQRQFAGRQIIVKGQRHINNVAAETDLSSSLYVNSDLLPSDTISEQIKLMENEANDITIPTVQIQECCNTKEFHTKQSIPRRLKRSLKNNTLQYIRGRKEQDFTLRKKQLELDERKIVVEERRVAIEEARFELEKEERLQRLQIEIEERRNKLYLEKQQCDIGNFIVKQLLNE